MSRRAVRRQEVRLRRELNSHDAAKPRTASQAQRRARHRACTECGRTERTRGQFVPPSTCGSHEAIAQRRPKTRTRCATSRPGAALGTTDLQSVRGAAAAGIGASGVGQLSRRLERVVYHGLERGAGSTGGSRPEQQVPRRARPADAALPNPSLNTRPPTACRLGRAAVQGYHRPRGPGVMPRGSR
jgi:hypothetical protein